ncbi:hypothetical protein Aperf_G00000039262 [Anoplocephala perfoliata]
MEPKESRRGHPDSESECDIKNPLQNFNLRNYLKEEIWQSSQRRNEANNSQEQICGPFRNRVWKFLSIPHYFESFMFYGLLQCLDHILMVYTFLPLRCILMFVSILLNMLFHFLSFWIPSLRPEKFTLYATDVRELVKFSFVCICTIFLYTFDSSIAYHEIRTQSVIKIYIFFNLLEVADRLLSAVYLDAVDDVLYTVSAGLSRHRGKRWTPPSENDDNASTENVGFGAFIAQYLFALVCLSLHCLLLLAQVTTLNVAFNSQNRSLLTVMISNNFVEVKSNVFRKMGKSNLFQIACADVRERFHYAVWLFIIVCRNLSASGWKYDDFLALLPDILLILLAEVAVDWIKHAFISKFNVISSDVYEEYTVSIAYDLLLCRQGKSTSDYFELLARRMGLTPISLSCLINVMIIQTVKSSWIYVFLLLALPLLFVLKVLVHIILLNRAYAHVHAYTQMMTAKMAKEAAASATDSAAVSSAASLKNATVANTKSAVSGKEEKDKRMFYPPYTGYDQPTRDEGQLAMPQLLTRRSYSDTNFSAAAAAVAAAAPVKSDDIEEEGGDTEEQEDFCSLLSSSTDNSTQPQRAVPKSPLSEIEARFRQFLVDVDDMEICHRGTTHLPLLSTLPSGEGTMDSPGYTVLSSLSPASVGSMGFFSTPNHQLYPEPVSSSLKRNTLCEKRPATVFISRRKCCSLNDLIFISSERRNEYLTSTPMLEKCEKHVRFIESAQSVPIRRRLHTENEISSMLILEQLSSVLNDETAHLEDAVDVDLLSVEEIAASGKANDGIQETGVGEREKQNNVSQVTSTSINQADGDSITTDASTASVKQPLSNVDRYSMLGGQIG